MFQLYIFLKIMVGGNDIIINFVIVKLGKGIIEKKKCKWFLKKVFIIIFEVLSIYFMELVQKLIGFIEEK